MQFPCIDFLKTDFISIYLRNLTVFITNKFKQQKVFNVVRSFLIKQKKPTELSNSIGLILVPLRGIEPLFSA